MSFESKDKLEDTLLRCFANIIEKTEENERIYIRRTITFECN